MGISLHTHNARSSSTLWCFCMYISLLLVSACPVQTGVCISEILRVPNKSGLGNNSQYLPSMNLEQKDLFSTQNHWESSTIWRVPLGCPECIFVPCLRQNSCWFISQFQKEKRPCMHKILPCWAVVTCRPSAVTVRVAYLLATTLPCIIWL